MRRTSQPVDAFRLTPDSGTTVVGLTVGEGPRASPPLPPLLSPHRQTKPTSSGSFWPGLLLIFRRVFCSCYIALGLVLNKCFLGEQVEILQFIWVLCFTWTSRKAWPWAAAVRAAHGLFSTQIAEGSRAGLVILESQILARSRSTAHFFFAVVLHQIAFKPLQNDPRGSWCPACPSAVTDAPMKSLSGPPYHCSPRDFQSHCSLRAGQQIHWWPRQDCGPQEAHPLVGKRWHTLERSRGQNKIGHVVAKRQKPRARGDCCTKAICHLEKSIYIEHFKDTQVRLSLIKGV